MSECLNFLFFIDAVKVLVCNCIQLKSFGMKCHLSMHVLTQDGLQVLNLFGLKFLHVIFEACGGPQTFDFSFLEG